jgi:aspartate/methionine/tyrosine aminotransferase
MAGPTSIQEPRLHAVARVATRRGGEISRRCSNFLISANSFVQRAGIAALSNEGNEAVARMWAVYDKRRKLMVELMRGVGFGIPVMPQGAFYVFADALMSR